MTRRISSQPQESNEPPFGPLTPELRFEGVKKFVGFGSKDAERLRSVAQSLDPVFPAVVASFYAELHKDPEAYMLFVGGEDQLARLRATLILWLQEIFHGLDDDDYMAKRSRIGRTHVRVSLPQHFMITSMEFIRQQLDTAIRRLGRSDADAIVQSLQKALAVDLCLMMEAYKENYTTQIRSIERSLMEERLTRVEHLAGIGQLAASLAHEIKNPLAGISGAIQIIRDGMSKDNPHRPIVAEILDQISRLDATVKDLLLYARPTAPRLTTCCLEDLYRRVLLVLQTEPALEKVSVDYSESPGGGTVQADDGQLEQLLINLILNAAHASPPGSTIHVNASFDEREVTLLVQDKGKGMEKSVQEAAFEPFFTTNAKGTGLGLSICRRIVASHGGNISLQSEIGRGTTVTVRLPSSGLTTPPARQDDRVRG